MVCTLSLELNLAIFHYKDRLFKLFLITFHYPCISFRWGRDSSMTMIVYTLFCVNLYLVSCSHTFTCKLISFICQFSYVYIFLYVCIYTYLYLYLYVDCTLLCGGNKEYLSIFVCLMCPADVNG